jgi:hypothetical protein
MKGIWNYFRGLISALAESRESVAVHRKIGRNWKTIDKRFGGNNTFPLIYYGDDYGTSVAVVYRNPDATIKRMFIVLNPDNIIKNITKSLDYVYETDEYKSRDRAILTFCHEFQHLVQYRNQDLIRVRDKGDIKIRYWKGNIYETDHLSLTDREYANLPWEREANDVALIVSKGLK